MMISKTRSNLIKILLLVSFLLPTFTSGAGLVMADTAPPVLDLNGEATGVDYNAIFAEDEGYKAIVSTTGLTILNGDDDVLTGASAVLTNPSMGTWSR